MSGPALKFPELQSLKGAASSVPLSSEDEDDVRAIVDDIFNYHAPDERKLDDIGKVRAAAKKLAYTIMTRVPAGPDRTASIRKLRECLMTANAAIVLSQ